MKTLSTALLQDQIDGYFYMLGDELVVYILKFLEKEGDLVNFACSFKRGHGCVNEIIGVFRDIREWAKYSKVPEIPDNAAKTWKSQLQSCARSGSQRSFLRQVCWMLDDLNAHRLKDACLKIKRDNFRDQVMLVLIQPIFDLFHQITAGKSILQSSTRRMMEMKEMGSLNHKYDGQSLLHWAVSHNLYDLVDLLLRSGADINLCTDNGHYTCLHIAVQNSYRKKEPAMKMIELLLKDKTIDVKMKDAYGSTAIYNSLISGHREILELLLQNTTMLDINVAVAFGITLLHEVVLGGDYDGVKLFLSKGADINLQDDQGQTPLHYSVMEGNPQITNCLIDAKADVSIRNNHGMTPLDEAVAKGNVEMIKCLIKQRETNTVDVVKIKELFVKGDEKVDSVDKHGRTALHWAVLENDLGMARTLLEWGEADPNAIDKFGCSPFHWALKYAKKEMIDLLREKGGVIKK